MHYLPESVFGIWALKIGICLKFDWDLGFEI